MRREPGHSFLKRLGKTKLRAGGVKATNWLFSKLNLDENSRVLEVACNEAYSLIDFAKKYKNKNVGIDKSASSIESAKKRVKEEGLCDYIDLFVGDARKLPFEDESFDVVINEAMLTMMPFTVKKEILKEYYRVLKKGGILLTHDVLLVGENDEQLKKLQKAVNIAVNPLSKDDWLNLFKEAGFKNMEYDTGKINFLTDEGLLADEGEEGRDRILKNAQLEENCERFNRMRAAFSDDNCIFRYFALKSEK